jgi:hypothetical protein
MCNLNKCLNIITTHFDVLAGMNEDKVDLEETSVSEVAVEGMVDVVDVEGFVEVKDKNMNLDHLDLDT